MKEKLLLWLETFLVANVFVVIIGFIWFVVALTGRFLGIPLGWEIWYRLWQPLFNPAIGILLAGIFLSWGLKKLGNFAGKR
ncbi:MAG: hypothetical protein NZ901_09410 [Geminocystis sp.]|nr:hypothetical protein [Geminocystis sp.]HIK38882.1 hypothetical protein [Geminocystis sp. M7585_C2015_104]MCS7148392.1 hypothetical protein [Geminocystis sp.]MCX8078293.1 hypothetical protein [Geminocystis sp.]MDW8116019.1 hypothetical protein [Geminocystis sp.]